MNEEARKEALEVWPHIREMEPSFYRAIAELGEHMSEWQKRQGAEN